MIKVLHAGIYCTVQDLGRIGYAKMGVPQGGALDIFAAKRANLILNQSEAAAVLEITYGQGRFEFTIDTFIALSGGHFSPKLNAIPVEMNKVLSVKKGAVLSFGKRNYGARVYLSVQGGLYSETVLGSKSFYPGLTSAKLAKGDTINLNPTQNILGENRSKLRLDPTHFAASELTCYPGPEYDHLNEVQKERLRQPFTISEDNNRVGYRLNEILANDLQPILTSAVLPGTVQLTPSGKLIILMRDCQVTGGYPRVLQLSDEAVSRMGQKVVGEHVKFCCAEEF